jgi:hypothetical protein
VQRTSAWTTPCCFLQTPKQWLSPAGSCPTASVENDFLTQEVAQVLIQVLVISHLDNCNSAGWVHWLCHQTLATYSERRSQPAWCWTFPSYPMSPSSSALSTGSQWKLASTSRPWCLTMEQQGELPPPYLQAVVEKVPNCHTWVKVKIPQKMTSKSESPIKILLE